MTVAGSMAVPITRTRNPNVRIRHSRPHHPLNILAGGYLANHRQIRIISFQDLVQNGTSLNRSRTAFRCIPSLQPLRFRLCWRESVMAGPLEFTLNGGSVRIDDRSPNTTLLEYLRAIGLTGAKEGCAEGD